MQKIQGYTIKTTSNPKDPIDMKIHGILTFDDAVGLALYSLRGFLNTTVHQMKLAGKPKENQTPEEEDKTIRAVLYDKVVLQFSHLMDDFFPEAKDLKHKWDDFKEFLEKENVDVTYADTDKQEEA